MTINFAKIHILNQNFDCIKVLNLLCNPMRFTGIQYFYKKITGTCQHKICIQYSYMTSEMFVT